MEPTCFNELYSSVFVFGFAELVNSVAKHVGFIIILLLIFLISEDQIATRKEGFLIADILHNPHPFQD